MILVLGGSQFMGLDLLTRLSSMPEKYKVVYVNRNKPYWNKEVTALPNLTYYPGNRDEYKDFIKLLVFINYQ